MEGCLSALVGLAFAQVILYEISSKRALKAFLFLSLFYFFLFSFTRGLLIFCDLFSISFYAIPLLSLTLLVIFGREPTRFPHFQKSFGRAPAFYLFSGLWVSFVWFGKDWNLIQGFLQSFLAAFLLPVLAGIKERLRLTDPPRYFAGPPLLLISAGILLLGLLFLMKFSN